MDVHELSNSIESKKDFESFLAHLLADFKNNANDWENNTLENFLEALHAYTKDVEGYYKNMNIPFDENNLSWKIFAQLLLGAKVYE